MTRNDALAASARHFATGAFQDRLARLIAVPTESQKPDKAAALRQYLDQELLPDLAAMGFTCRILEHAGAKGPFLLAERIEDPALPTILGYGHGDVTPGQDEQWQPGLSPWQLQERDGHWYGRGIADNKGQHAVNLAAQAHVIATRGRLGFNAKWLIEMGEEVGSPGLAGLCAAEKSALAADLLVASDGPRLSADRPTVFLGARGAMQIDLVVELRSGGHHSGNWGGLLANPGILLAHAIASIVGANGQIRVPDLVPADGIPANVRAALADCPVVESPNGPKIDSWWGEPGLSAAEKVYGWCNFEVLACEVGTPSAPVNAIPPRAWARCQLRHVVGVPVEAVLPALRRHLERQGLGMVQVRPGRDTAFRPTRLDPDHPAVGFTLASIQATTGKKPALLPNLGGALPNDIFAETLGLPTIWVPHSYASCSQHAPNEHLPAALLGEALQVMTGLYWDLGADLSWCR